MSNQTWTITWRTGDTFDVRAANVILSADTFQFRDADPAAIHTVVSMANVRQVHRVRQDTMADEPTGPVWLVDLLDVGVVGVDHGRHEDTPRGSLSVQEGCYVFSGNHGPDDLFPVGQVVKAVRAAW